MKRLGVIDEIVSEPLGGAHRNPRIVYDNLRKALHKHLNHLLTLDPETLKIQRTEKFMKMSRNFEISKEKPAPSKKK